MHSLEEKAKYAHNLKYKYIDLYAKNENDKAIKLEKEYLRLRGEVLHEIDEEIVRQKSETMDIVKKRVAKRKKPKRIETGIRELDYELVSEDMKMRGIKGGLSLGNFIQISGSKGAGKSSMMLKILTGFSLSEKVSWFDFEMGEARVIEKLSKFEHNDKNMLYYSSSRKLKDVICEIKFLNAMGVNHFVVDSAMKIHVPNADRYEKFSTISGEMSELTSSLNINIYMINQMAQGSIRDGELTIKHGNDAEYDADFMFFLLHRKLVEDGEIIKDEAGISEIDQTIRVLKCTKNRQDDRLFTVEIPRSSIEGISPTIIEYE